MEYKTQGLKDGYYLAKDGDGYWWTTESINGELFFNNGKSAFFCDPVIPIEIAINAPELQEENARLREALQEAIDAMYSEYMCCPWCTGHMGINYTEHDDYCIINALKGGE